ncbi:HAD family hydrolase [Paenisporosarcina antarctica]|uniref:HAD family hydrolase n=1 Tax=Paenisporosarcina antarctica TaxID=417367 RepID=A0A4P6ZTZ6_9BACL|nr:HAD family hydrolase [Paenisporosarcina antarctica]QBP39940.1 HAD family hydrolase [Paenisporosarcina antarctica]
MKAILFDLDGTLLNREATLLVFCKAQHQKFKLPLTQEEFVKRVVELDANGYVPKDIVYRQIAKDIDLSAEMEKLLFEDYINHFHKFCVPFEGLIETLTLLKRQNFLLGLISNGRHAGQQASIEALSIESFFDVVLISESQGLSKPDAAIFERGLERLNVKASEACYVGDHPINDIEAARKVGLMTIWKRNGQYKDILADKEIDTLPEILSILKVRNST